MEQELSVFRQAVSLASPATLPGGVGMATADLFPLEPTAAPAVVIPGLDCGLGAASPSAPGSLGSLSEPWRLSQSSTSAAEAFQPSPFFQQTPDVPDWDFYGSFLNDMLPPSDPLFELYGSPSQWEPFGSAGSTQALHSAQANPSFADRCFYEQASKKDLQEAASRQRQPDAVALDFDEPIPRDTMHGLFDSFWEQIRTSRRRSACRPKTPQDPAFPIMYMPDPACRSLEYFAQWPVLLNAMLAMVAGMYEPPDLADKPRLNSVSLEALFFNRARYYLAKAGGEPSLQVIQSLLVRRSRFTARRADGSHLNSFSRRARSGTADPSKHVRTLAVPVPWQWTRGAHHCELRARSFCTQFAPKGRPGQRHLF
jgi:hypothetical protein